MSERPPARGVRRAASRPDEGRRLAVVVFVGVLVAALLVAGRAVPGEHATVPPAPFPSNLVPVVDLHTTSSIWNCPGPLPAGTGTWHSAVAVSNPGTATVSVELVVAATPIPSSAQAAPAPLAPVTEHLLVDAGNERVVQLPTSGSATRDAVSVLASGGAVAVSEAVQSTGTPLSSPCQLGSATSAYLPLGSTIGASDLQLALFDAGATPAVADVRAGLSGGSSLPAALEGVTVSPGTVTVLDVGRSVVQAGLVGLTVTAVTGRLSVGAAEVQLSTVKKATVTTPSALFVSLGSTRPDWELPPPTAGMPAQSVRVLDPSHSPAVVTVSESAPGAKPASITETVAPGSVLAVTVPSPVWPRTAKGHSAPPRLPDGPVRVSVAHGVGVVVGIAGQASGANSGIDASSLVATAASAAGLVLSGATVSSTVHELLELTNTGTRPADVTIAELSGAVSPSSALSRSGTLGAAGSPGFSGASGAGGSVVSVLGTVSVPAGSGYSISLSKYLSSATALALVLHSTEPVVVTQSFLVVKATGSTIPQRSLVEGVPEAA